ncbi:MAG: head GIN domain-containing protein [Bacteroidia bacterium]
MQKHLSILLALLLALPALSLAQRITGSGHVISETRNHSGFDGIVVSGAIHVYVHQGNRFAVRVEADDNVIPYIRTEVSRTRLVISHEGSLHNTTTMAVHVTLPELKSIEASGASMVRGETPLRGQELALRLSGASHAHFELNHDLVLIEAGGASILKLSGKTVHLEAVVEGASQLKAGELQADTGDIAASGASQAIVAVAASLRADASGASHITSAVNPQDSDLQSSGASSIKLP